MFTLIQGSDMLSIFQFSNRPATKNGNRNLSSRFVRMLRTIGNSIANNLQLRHLRLQGKIGIGILIFFVLISIFGQFLAPYDPNKRQFDAEGKLKSLYTPSTEHLLGTTWQGRDVLSQLLYGARPTLVVAAVAAFIIAFCSA